MFYDIENWKIFKTTNTCVLLLIGENFTYFMPKYSLSKLISGSWSYKIDKNKMIFYDENGKKLGSVTK